MAFRDGEEYRPLIKGIERNSGAFEWVSCGAHQSHAVKQQTNALDCTKSVQFHATGFGCGS